MEQLLHKIVRFVLLVPYFKLCNVFYDVGCLAL
jgi:hypothetical protein